MTESGWLYGWKEIGNYIGCSDKQAQYYATKHHLPIVRLPKNKPAADPSEIDNWMRTRNKNKN
jgi:hypothetical protein